VSFADAAFDKPEIYEGLEKRDVKYALRIPTNDSLERDIAELLTRPVGRPSHKPVVRYKSLLYQAAGWKKAQRVVAKVEFHVGELFARFGFIVSNLELPSRAVVRFYNKCGTTEQWIKEGKQAVKMTRLSCRRFRSNEVRLWLSVVALSLGNLWRRLVLRRRIGSWTLSSLQPRLVMTGGTTGSCWRGVTSRAVCLEPCWAGSQRFSRQRVRRTAAQAGFQTTSRQERKKGVGGIGRERGRLVLGDSQKR
jgi:hypothetical protein